MAAGSKTKNKKEGFRKQLAKVPKGRRNNITPSSSGVRQVNTDVYKE